VPWATLANIVGYQLVWFVAVDGAAHQLTWPATVSASTFIALQLTFLPQPAQELRLLLLALGCGLVVDGFLAASGLVRYAAASPALPPGGAPLWILALWAAFATTLLRSLAWLTRRPAWAVLFGAVGAPLAYCAAERGFGAVHFAAPAWRGELVLGAGWAVALWLLSRPAARVRREFA
jgi:hypothetical protein